jgi:hypothetical protein
MDIPILDISRVIQLSVAPVFLLMAIASLITGLNNRLARIVDRRRVVQEKINNPASYPTPDALLENRTLFQRMRLIYFSIFTAVLSALMICLVVAGAFSAALLSVNFSKAIAILFIIAMIAMIACFTLFLREIFLAVTTMASNRLNKL